MVAKDTDAVVHVTASTALSPSRPSVTRSLVAILGPLTASPNSLQPYASVPRTSAQKLGSLASPLVALVVGRTEVIIVIHRLRHRSVARPNVARLVCKLT